MLAGKKKMPARFLPARSAAAETVSRERMVKFQQ